MRFEHNAISSVPQIKEVDALQMRRNNSNLVDRLSGSSAMITPDIFFIALDGQFIKQNYDLMSRGDWFDLPASLSDGRIVKITFEKGGPGSKLFKEVFAQWQT